MVKGDTVFANVHIGTGLNCDKDPIPTVKIGVFRMYLGSKKDAENLTSVPEKKLTFLPAIILTRTLQMSLRKPHFTIAINF